MKKFFKISAAVIAAVLLTTVFASAAVANVSEETVSFTSTAMPSLNCSMALSQAHAIYSLLPGEIRYQAKKGYEEVKSKCEGASNFRYQGVNVKVTGNEESLTFTFRYQGYTVRVADTTWEHLDSIFLK